MNDTWPLGLMHVCQITTYPKLSFKHRSITSVIKKAVNFTPESTSLKEKPSISRTFSLTKIFSTRINRTSSLPIAHIAHLNSKSARVGNLGGFVNCSRNGSMQ